MEDIQPKNKTEIIKGELIARDEGVAIIGEEASKRLIGRADDSEAILEYQPPMDAGLCVTNFEGRAIMPKSIPDAFKKPSRKGGW